MKIKLFESAEFLPVYSTPDAIGADVRACITTPVTVHPGETATIPLGFSLELPKGHAALLLPRSGLGVKSGIVLGNLVGVCDPDYRGQYMAAVWYRQEGPAFTINRGDRIAQLVIVPAIQAQFETVEELGNTVRGEGGFGSTGTQ